MASFISSLSLFALVFISACFTLPIVDQQLENATSSLFNVDLTTEKVVNLRLVADDESTGFPFSSSQQPSNDMFSADQTSSMVSMEMNRLNEKRMDVEMSTSTGSFMTEDASRAPRTFDEFSTMESSTFFPTTESSSHHRRGENEVSMTTFEPTTQGFEPTTQIFEHVSRSMNVNSDNETETQSTPIKRNFDDSSFTTSEPSMQSSTSEAEPSSDQHPREVSETGMTMELTTQFMPSFTSTSSAVAPQFYTSESSTFTSTQPFTSQSSSTKKYTGLLNDESEHGINEDEHEKPKRPSQESEFFKSSSTKFQSKVETEEDSKYAHIPTAVFDQDILKKIANVPSDFMFLDEKSDVITVAPSKSLFTTMENHLSQEKLNQGKDKTHVEEEESNH